MLECGHPVGCLGPLTPTCSWCAELQIRDSRIASQGRDIEARDDKIASRDCDIRALHQCIDKTNVTLLPGEHRFPDVTVLGYVVVLPGGRVLVGEETAILNQSPKEIADS